jgi:DNA-binding LacI/PurR family transcriptional regulator
LAVPGTKTIRDVAREAGVSIATVSYVLNNSRSVGPQTRERVLEAARKLAYRPNITARNLQASETRLFAYTWRPDSPDHFNPILDRFLQSAVDAAAERGYRFLVFATATIEDEVATYETLMLEGQVDGFVLSNTNLDDARVRRLLGAGFPFVAFGRSNPDWDFPCVDIDGSNGVRRAVEHLIERGHCRIGVLAWPEASLTGRFRLQGYFEAMAGAHLAARDVWIKRIENRYADAYDATVELLREPVAERITALVAMSDLMAAAGVNAGWDAGLEPGVDLAFVGFDDSPVTKFIRPALSSLRQPIAEVGRRLVDMLVALCQGEPIADRIVVLQPELIVRASSDRPYRGPIRD